MRKRIQKVSKKEKTRIAVKEIKKQIIIKKRLLGLMAIVVIAAVAAWNIYVSQSKNEMALSDVALENVEALAKEDSDIIDCTAFPNCSSTCPWEWCGYCMGFYMQECIL
jgi:hypothetical protein